MKTQKTEIGKLTIVVASVLIALNGCATKAPPAPQEEVQTETKIVEAENTASAESPAVEPKKPGLLTSFMGLIGSLFESEEEQEKRLGITSSSELKEPPVVEYTLTDAEKEQVTPPGGALLDAFGSAKVNDPAYKAALQEFNVKSIQADVASLAYTPRVSLDQRFLPNENSSRRTISITQPLLDVRLLATTQEEESLRIRATAEYVRSEHELSSRLLDAVLAIIRNRENISVNDARVKSLQSQVESATEQFKLGSGAITDLRDAETRLEKAKAESIRFESELRNANRKFNNLTGKSPNPGQFKLAEILRPLAVENPDRYKDKALASNPDLIIARAEERLIELAALKAKSAYLPAVELTSARSRSSAGDFNNSGVTLGLSVPLSASTFYEAQAATARITQQRLKTEQITKDLGELLDEAHAKVIAGQLEVQARKRAIDSAELSLEANQKSYEGGVRTRLDVLNAVETLYNVKLDYLDALTELTKSYLSLRNLSAMNTNDSISALQKSLF